MTTPTPPQDPQSFFSLISIVSFIGGLFVKSLIDHLFHFTNLKELSNFASHFLYTREQYKATTELLAHLHDLMKKTNDERKDAVEKIRALHWRRPILYQLSCSASIREIEYFYPNDNIEALINTLIESLPKPPENSISKTVCSTCRSCAKWLTTILKNDHSTKQKES